jgi:hypothetical protein
VPSHAAHEGASDASLGGGRFGQAREREAESRQVKTSFHDRPFLYPSLRQTEHRRIRSICASATSTVGAADRCDRLGLQHFISMTAYLPAQPAIGPV